MIPFQLTNYLDLYQSGRGQVRDAGCTGNPVINDQNSIKSLVGNDGGHGVHAGTKPGNLARQFDWIGSLAPGGGNA